MQAYTAADLSTVLATFVMATKMNFVLKMSVHLFNFWIVIYSTLLHQLNSDKGHISKDEI